MNIQYPITLNAGIAEAFNNNTRLNMSIELTNHILLGETKLFLDGEPLRKQMINVSRVPTAFLRGDLSKIGYIPTIDHRSTTFDSKNHLIYIPVEYDDNFKLYGLVLKFYPNATPSKPDNFAVTYLFGTGHAVTDGRLHSCDGWFNKTRALSMLHIAITAPKKLERYVKTIDTLVNTYGINLNLIHTVTSRTDPKIRDNTTDFGELGEIDVTKYNNVSKGHSETEVIGVEIDDVAKEVEDTSSVLSRVKMCTGACKIKSSGHMREDTGPSAIADTLSGIEDDIRRLANHVEDLNKAPELEMDVFIRELHYQVRSTIASELKAQSFTISNLVETAVARAYAPNHDSSKAIGEGFCNTSGTVPSGFPVTSLHTPNGFDVSRRRHKAIYAQMNSEQHDGTPKATPSNLKRDMEELRQLVTDMQETIEVQSKQIDTLIQNSYF